MGSDPKAGIANKRAHQTQWAAQFAVASELCKRGYEVSFTMGDTTPVADLMVVSPKTGGMFLVDVKGLYSMNPWQVKRICRFRMAVRPTGRPVSEADKPSSWRVGRKGHAGNIPGFLLLHAAQPQPLPCQS